MAELINREDAINLLRSMPAADTRGEGMWRMTDEKGNRCAPIYAQYWFCTKCRDTIRAKASEPFEFCPRCGAVMTIDYDFMFGKGTMYR